MANPGPCICSVFACALALAAPAARAQAPDSSLVVPFQSRYVELDGDLQEWEAARSVRLNEPALLVRDGEKAHWQGLNDLSATLHLSYDTAHFYLAGEVLDSDLVPGDETERGDAIWVFFDFDPAGESDEEAADRPRDVVKLILMPLNPVRRWRVLTEVGAGRLEQLGGAALTGVRVVTVPQAGRGYTFEAVIPFHNFPGLPQAAGAIGFDITVEDRDGVARSQSMRLTGDAPADAPHPLLRFAGERLPLEVGPEEGEDFYEQLRGWGGYVLWPALILLVGAICLRGWGWISGRYSVLRLSGQALGVLLLVMGLLLPALLAKLREVRAESQLTRVVDDLQQQLPEMEKGTLGSYRGGERDRPFVDLMSGQAVPRKQTVSHELLSDLAPGAFGPGPQRSPDIENRPLRPYWIPLPSEQTEQISFSSPLRGAYLNVILALPTFVRRHWRPPCGSRCSSRTRTRPAPSCTSSPSSTSRPASRSLIPSWR